MPQHIITTPIAQKPATAADSIRWRWLFRQKQKALDSVPAPLRNYNPLPEQYALRPADSSIGLFDISNQQWRRHDTSLAYHYTITYPPPPETPHTTTYTNPYNNAYGSTDWLVVLLMLSIVLVTFVRVYYRGYVRNMFRAGVNRRLLLNMFNVNNAQNQNATNGLWLIFTLNFAMLVFLAIRHYGAEKLFSAGMGIYFTVFGLLAIIYIFKRLAFNFLGNLTHQRESFGEYWFTVATYNRIAGIAIIPFLFIIPFRPAGDSVVFIWIALSLYGVLFVARLWRGWQIILKKQISFFYRIMYLCVLEILPLMLVLKLTISIL